MQQDIIVIRKEKLNKMISHTLILVKGTHPGNRMCDPNYTSYNEYTFYTENETLFISIVNEQQKERIHKTHGNINITYSAWSDECDTPAEIHAVFAFYKNERTVNATDDLVKTMTEMIQEIFDAAEQDN